MPADERRSAALEARPTRGFVDRSQLHPVPVGLLEVEAEDLLVLQHAIARRRLEPRGELFMELCA